MSHLPASRLVDEIQVVALVDLELERACRLAQTYDVPLATTDYREIVGWVDAVIVAIPHHLHAAVALDFLGRGIHVLVEKPMATSRGECEEMIATARQAAAKLGVGLVRRFFDSNRLAERLIRTRFLGNVKRFEAEESVLFDRFKASPFTVLPPSGGVLLDTGPHTLDLLLWWLGDFDEVSYWDDARGGVEANCRLEVKVNGIPGTVEMSRTRHLSNRIRIFCENGTIEVQTLNPAQVFIDSPLFSGPICAAKMVEVGDARQLPPFFARQLSDFALTIMYDREPFVPGSEGIRSIEVIEQCKSQKQLLETMPWMALDEQLIGRIR
jgi:predicted dehydrogenase